MSVFRTIPALAALEGPSYLAIGVFDGVHRGHRAVIERALEDARREPGGHAVVVTFEPHPMRVLRPEAAPRLLTSPPHLLKVLARLGVPNVLVLPFDRAFAARAPEDFIGDLVRHCRPLRQICVGYDWSFGRGRSGNVDSLTRLGREFGFTCVGLPPVLDRAGQQISSTLIRGAVAEGDFARAAELLGREFTILGTVIAGRKLARTLGFPTANLAAHNEQFPPNGVYAAAAWVDGRERPGILNLGVRPTVDGSGERLLELHIFDFEGDLYGRDIEVAFRRFLRPEQKFSGLEALKAQIALDCAEARNG